MITLAEVKDWLKTFGVGEHFYVGKLENRKEKSIGVYQRKGSGPPGMALGGRHNRKYEMKPVSVLIHWTKNARETEEASFLFFESLLQTENVKIGQIPVSYIRLMVPEPQDVGTDENGVYERVIWFDLYYER